MEFNMEFNMESREIVEIAIRKIKSEICYCRSKHNITPRYVKLPTWLLLEMRACQESTFYLDESEKVVDVICGLIACPTDLISTINEIEVF